MSNFVCRYSRLGLGMCTGDRLLLSIRLQVELPMLLEMGYKGAVDLENNRTVGGRTRHVDVRNHFLRDLKDGGLIIVRHVPGEKNDADIFTQK